MPLIVSQMNTHQHTPVTVGIGENMPTSNNNGTQGNSVSDIHTCTPNYTSITSNNVPNLVSCTQSHNNNSTSNLSNVQLVNDNNLAQLYVSRPSDDIARHISPNLRQKIISGENIDLSLLLENTQSMREYGMQQKIIMVQGELVVQHKHEAKTIVSVETWTDEFLVFMSVYCSVHRDQYLHLLKYMNIIRLGAKRICGMGWKTYDEQFRLRKAQKPLFP